MMRYLIVFIGAPCSGKSTIAKEVVQMVRARYISSGDIARSMIGVQPSLDKGEMAPEEEMRNAILNAILNIDNDRDRGRNTFILDGFPRFAAQYEFLKDNLPNYNMIFVQINVSRDNAMLRARSRGRSDDNAFKTRFENYEHQVEPMMASILANDERVINIDNDHDCSIRDISQVICTILGRIMR